MYKPLHWYCSNDSSHNHSYVCEYSSHNHSYVYEYSSHNHSYVCEYSSHNHSYVCEYSSHNHSYVVNIINVDKTSGKICLTKIKPELGQDPHPALSSYNLWFKNACHLHNFCRRGLIFFRTVGTEKLFHSMQISRCCQKCRKNKSNWECLCISFLQGHVRNMQRPATSSS